MKKINLALICFLLSFNVLSQFTEDQKVELNKKIYKTELFLKEKVLNDLTSMLGSNSLLLSVSLKVDENAVFNEAGGLDDKWNKVKDMQLPGLFLDSGSQESLKEVDSITEESVLAHIKTLAINLTVTQSNIDLQKAKVLTELVVKSNYSRADAIDLQVQVNYSAPVIAPQIQNLSSKVQSIAPYIGIALCFLVVGMIGLYLAISNFKKSIQGLNEIIEKKDFGGSISLKQPQIPQESQKRKKSAALTNNSSALAVDKYYELVQKIRENLESHYEVISQMISFNFHLEEYQKIVVLMEVIPADKRDRVYASLPSANVKKFKDYLIFNGDDLYDDGNLLLEAAKDIIKMISLSTINSENFYSYYLKEISSGLNVKEISTIINDLTINEFMYFIEFVDKASLGFAMASSQFDSMKLTADYRALDQAEVKLCVDKISKSLMVNSNQKALDPRESILPFLTGEMEKVVSSKLNIDETHTFDYLVKNNLSKVADYLKDLQYEDMVSTLSLFKEPLRDDLIVKMPDILAERLLKETYALSKASLSMKSVLIRHLQVITPVLEQSA